MIDLSKILVHLPDNKVKELEAITEQIVATGEAEIIVLFGSYARGDYKEKRGEIQGRKSDYDILVVTSDWENKYPLSSRLNSCFNEFDMVVQIVVEDINHVNDNLEEKQYFFSDIKREGKVLYNSGRYELADSKELTPTRRREIAEEDYKAWHTQARCSWEDYQNNYHKLPISAVYAQRSSFHLQQAVEMCYTAIEMVFTHYNPYEHQLTILRMNSGRFDRRVQEAFPLETKEQIELFHHLNFAYIGGRYKSEEEYPVTDEQLNYWGGETEKLLELTEIICKERIRCLKEVENERGV